MPAASAAAPLWRLSAREAVRRLRSGALRPSELLAAYASRLEAHDGAVNAAPILCLERARAAAAALEREGWPADAEQRPGYLYGLPILIKDTMAVEGVRFTAGSPLVDCIAGHSDVGVEVLEANGGIVFGKTNTPEFAAGSNTFNAIFGATTNPWDTRVTCGGSSGGSAAALAAGFCALASGSDLGGSLRIPASFCSVVGLRPAPGRVPRGPVDQPFDWMAVNGPMGRDVRDCALMLDAMCGAREVDTSADPLAYHGESRGHEESFLAAAERAAWPARVAWSRDLGGISPVDDEVAAICERAARRFQSDGGGTLVDVCPDLSGAQDIFMALRAEGMAAKHGEQYANLDKRRQLKDDLQWNISVGLEQSPAHLRAMQKAQAALARRAADFFGEFDVLATPCVMAPPFDVSEPWLKEVAGQPLDNYTEWLRMTYALTLTQCPALSVPAGFTEAGLPVGLQLVGRPRGEAALLSAASALERALVLAHRVPLDPRVLGEPL